MARMRARADAQIAEASAQMRAAGIDRDQPMPSVRDMFKESVEGFKDVWARCSTTAATCSIPARRTSTGMRPPIDVDDHPRQSFLSEVFDMFDPFGVSTAPQVFNRNERPSLGPYCGTLD